MRKFNIVEIENSYLNFFTPAVIIAAGLFLFSVFNWPLSFLKYIISESDVNVNIALVGAVIANITGILVCIVVYFVFIPRLKVKDAKYENLSLQGVFIVASIFLVIICIRIILTFLFESLGSTIYLVYPWFIGSLSSLSDPLFFVQFIIYQFIVIPLYAELLYRRTVIPLLEDRGLSPFFAVVISSLGFCLLFLPEYLHPTNYIGTLYWFASTFLFGLATGLIYINTRNIAFSTLYAIIYYTYRFSGELGAYFQNELMISIHLFLNVLILIFGSILIVYVIWNLSKRKSSLRWVNIIKTSSPPKITRGVIGYFIISLVLVIIQLITTSLIATSTSSDILMEFLLNTIFYLIAFSIPFLLTITSEYVQY